MSNKEALHKLSDQKDAAVPVYEISSADINDLLNEGLLTRDVTGHIVTGNRVVLSTRQNNIKSFNQGAPVTLTRQEGIEIHLKVPNQRSLRTYDDYNGMVLIINPAKDDSRKFYRNHAIALFIND